MKLKRKLTILCLITSILVGCGSEGIFGGNTSSSSDSIFKDISSSITDPETSQITTGDNIGFEDTTRTVLNKLGDPDDENGNIWVYYKYSSSSFYNKWTKMNEYLSSSKTSDYTKGEEIYDELKGTSCVLLYVEFDNDKNVIKCFKDYNWSYSLSDFDVHNDKKIKNVEIVGNPSANYYYDGTIDQCSCLDKKINVSYYSVFEDDSYILSKTNAEVEFSSAKLSQFYTAKLKWEDEFTSYEKNNIQTNKVGDISSEGIITNWNSEYDFPFGEYELSENILNDSSFYEERDEYYYISFDHKVDGESVYDKYLVKSKNKREITIDNSITVIKKGAFKDCNKVQSVIVNGPSSGWGSNKNYLTIEQQAFEGANNLSKVYLTGELIIEEYAFDGVPNAELYFSLGSAYKGTVSTYYKYYQYNLDGTKHEEHWGVTLSSFNNIEMPEIYNYYFNDTLIGSLARNYEPELGEISSELSYIVDGISFNVGKVELVEHREEDDEYDYKIKYFLDGSPEIEFSIENGVCTITRYSGSSSNVVIPSKIILEGNKEINNIKIGRGAFLNCSSLTSITIPSSVTSIGSSAFFEYGSLKDVYYTGTIKEWCNITFSDWGSNPMTCASHFYMLDSNKEYKEVTSIEIPNTITSIGDYQFYGFSNLISITIPSSVTTIGECAFFGCSFLTIYCEASSKPSGWNFRWDWDSIECGDDGYFESSVPSYFGVTEKDIIEQNGIQYLIIDGNAVITRYVGTDINVVIPSTIEVNGTTYNVTEIGMEAFYDCDFLKNITIPNSVTTIGYYAFHDCISLKSIIIPSSVTYIGGCAFYDCDYLTIHCESSSKPSGWSYGWNSSNCTVVWGYKGS